MKQCITVWAVVVMLLLSFHLQAQQRPAPRQAPRYNPVDNGNRRDDDRDRRDDDNDNRNRDRDDDDRFDRRDDRDRDDDDDDWDDDDDDDHPRPRENWYPRHGNVGLGMPRRNVATERLHVIGNVKVSQTVFANALEATGLKATGLTVAEDASIGRNLLVNGNVGINVPNPTERLEIGGNLKVSQGIFANDGTVNNNFRIGSTLVVDGFAGIGTTTPTEKLDVTGNIKSSGDVLAVNIRADKGYFNGLESNGGLLINGNVGLGIAPGNDRLTVAGNAYVNGLLTADNLTVKQKLDIKGTFSLAGTLGIGVATPEASLHVSGDGKFEGDIRANKIIVNAIEIAGATQNPEGGSSVSLGDNLFVNGSMGIGTNKVNGFRLSVDGKIRAGDDIKVYSSTEWSDFVFADDYKLRPLSEVEQYISEHGHLPEIPSAKEVKANGIDLAAMDAKLLQKIEELTLYMIEMKKENETLKQEIQKLKFSKKN